MSKAFFLGPFLGLLVVGGCSSEGDDDVPATVTSGIELTFTDDPGTWCHTGDAAASVHAFGEPVTLRVRSAFVTKACRCQYTTTADWGCSGKKHCESEYDLGGDNPIVCNPLHEEASTIQDVTASVDKSECRVAAVVDPSQPAAALVTVTCNVEGAFVTIGMHTSDGPGEQQAFLLFTPDGQCPEPPEADAGGAGDGGLDSGDVDVPDGDASDG